MLQHLAHKPIAAAADRQRGHSLAAQVAPFAYGRRCNQVLQCAAAYAACHDFELRAAADRGDCRRCAELTDLQRATVIRACDLRAAENNPEREIDALFAKKSAGDAETQLQRLLVGGNSVFKRNHSTAASAACLISPSLYWPHAAVSCRMDAGSRSTRGTLSASQFPYSSIPRTSVAWRRPRVDCTWVGI